MIDFVHILARPPPLWLRVCVEGQASLLGCFLPFDTAALIGGCSVPLAVSGACPVRGPIPLPSTIIIPRLLEPSTLQPTQ